MSVLEHLPEGSLLAIIRLRSLGDCVLTTPAISLLHRWRPGLRISVVVEDRFRGVFDGNPAVSAVIRPSWQALRSARPALCVNLHGGTRSQLMTALSGAQWRAGFAHHSSTLAYNIKVPRAQRILGVSGTVHTAEHLASAFFAMGLPLCEVPRAELFATAPSLAGRYAVIHPFASAPEKQWPPEKFCEVARYLDLWKIKPVFLAGPNDETAPFRAHQVIQDSLAVTKSVLSKAAVFIGNDSGPAHMAAAFGVPSVVLFGASNPAIWGPWRTESEVIVAPEGIQQVSVSRIIPALERLLMLEEAHA